ncbi:MAG: hypothetical protein D3923_06710 [Candidatus Electrothrix sp. AR3]|nr:hypothetical protein [Candidatus Electrothrix sp. AR3]
MLNDIFLHHKWLNLRISKFTQTETTLDFGEDTNKASKKTAETDAIFKQLTLSGLISCFMN